MAACSFLALLIVLAQSGAVSSTDDTNTSARYQSVLHQYESSGDLAWAYRLHRLATIEGYPDLAAQWLNLLSDRNWKMGVDSSGQERDRVAALVELLQIDAGTRTHNSRRAHTINDAELIPESIAFDPSARVLYVGSLSKGKVAAFNLSISTAPEGADFEITGLGAVYGIKFDVKTRELWILHNRLADDKMFGNLSVYKPDGSLIREFASVNAEQSEFNDLCLTEQRVFITDSRNDAVLSGSRGGTTLQTFIKNGRLPYANGIACNDRSTTVIVAGATGIYRGNTADPASFALIDTQPGYSLGGVDGLYVHGETLIGIQNALGAPKVVTASLTQGQEVYQVEFHDVLSPEFRIPTTGFVHGNCFYYIANSSLDALDSDLNIDPAAMPPEQATILGLPLGHRNSSCRL